VDLITKVVKQSGNKTSASVYKKVITIYVAYSLKISEIFTLIQKWVQWAKHVSLEYNMVSDVTNCNPANILH